MLAFAQRSSTVLLVSGLLAVIVGVIAVAWPGLTILTLVLIWGWYALADGILALVAAFRSENRNSRVFLIVIAVIGVVAGLLAIFRPLDSGVALAWILGIWLLARGVSEFISAFSQKRETSRWLLLLGGVLFVVAGIIFIANPGTAALAVSRWLGICAILWGVFILGAGLTRRAAAKEAKQTVAA
ncbi:HdeD family acid-resistance protein [Corynebacterium comes]|uniref:Acid-resistance membrane protein n=1 Tax=Corynebacterium comes TaxID=2675218 RepID=A0A6B8VW12_9CORY|nr:DUF308 domain-containing protein [Corynebacterium comes]QGU05524.1 acid-resistance membrane protein [Corynebacterium comes]